MLAGNFNMRMYVERCCLFKAFVSPFSKGREAEITWENTFTKLIPPQTQEISTRWIWRTVNKCKAVDRIRTCPSTSWSQRDFHVDFKATSHHDFQRMTGTSSFWEGPSINKKVRNVLGGRGKWGPSQHSKKRNLARKYCQWQFPEGGNG